MWCDVIVYPAAGDWGDVRVERERERESLALVFASLFVKISRTGGGGGLQLWQFPTKIKQLLYSDTLTLHWDWGLLTAGFICLSSPLLSSLPLPSHRRPTGNFPGSCCWVSPPGASVASYDTAWPGLTLNTLTPHTSHLTLVLVLAIQILSQRPGITTILIQTGHKTGQGHTKLNSCKYFKTGQSYVFASSQSQTVNNYKTVVDWSQCGHW